MFSVACGLKLILASTSPRRKELLSSLGLDFLTFSLANSEPEPFTGEEPVAFANRAALAKAQACQKAFQASDIILGADTIVTQEGKIFCKPGNAESAFQMLSSLNGKTHQVITAYCLIYPENAKIKIHQAFVSTLVSFYSWSEDVLKNYAFSDEPLDKAGAYAIQGKGAFLINKIQGSWSNVVGLPLCEITAFLLQRKLICPSKK